MRQHQADTRALARVMAIVLSAIGMAGCAPRLIQDYSVRKGELVFAVQEGSQYQLGDCRRAADGQLSECRMYDVEFE